MNNFVLTIKQIEIFNLIVGYTEHCCGAALPALFTVCRRIRIGHFPYSQPQIVVHLLFPQVKNCFFRHKDRRRNFSIKCIANKLLLKTS